MTADSDQQTRQYLLARFWEAALGFWRNGGSRTVWALTFAVIAITVVNLVVQYRLNVWHRTMFDAIDRHDGGGVLHQTLAFIPLIAAVVGVAATATLAKMTLQRRWRAWLNARVLWFIGGEITLDASPTPWTRARRRGILRQRADRAPSLSTPATRRSPI